jgi:hypothetical protein
MRPRRVDCGRSAPIALAGPPAPVPGSSLAERPRWVGLRWSDVIRGNPKKGVAVVDGSRPAGHPQPLAASTARSRRRSAG